MRSLLPFQVMLILLPVAVALVMVALIVTLFSVEDFVIDPQKPVDADISRPAWLLLIPSGLLSLVLYLFVRARPDALLSLGWLCFSGLGGALVPVLWLYSDITRLQFLPTFALYSMPVVYTFGMVLGLFLGWGLFWIAAQLTGRN